MGQEPKNNDYYEPQNNHLWQPHLGVGQPSDNSDQEKKNDLGKSQVSPFKDILFKGVTH